MSHISIYDTYILTTTYDPYSTISLPTLTCYFFIAFFKIKTKFKNLFTKFIRLQYYCEHLS